MGFRSQTGSRRSGQKFQKSPHEKAKHKPHRNKATGQFAEETIVVSMDDLLNKTIERLNKLGGQTFAVSPFSQYFDDWLVNLRQVITEFESSPALNSDELFANERSRVLSEITDELAKRRILEAELDASIRKLTETNHIIAETDAAYAAQNREIAAKRNSEIERLTKAVHELENQLDRAQKTKTSFFNPSAKKNKAKEVAAANQNLVTTKSELETAVQNFAAEQEKLHDQYEKKKQEAMEKVRILEKEIADGETDTSLAVRQAACDTLAKAANALVKRKTLP
jgi:chromosome segregation ATPase